MAPAAATISVRNTIRILDGPFLPMANGVAQNLYALWLGSGISFGRVPGLWKVIENVLRYLQVRVVVGDANCRFRTGLQEILAIAQMSPVESAHTDLDRPIEEWPDREQFVGRLCGSYAKMLDVPIDDEEPDYLLWAGVNVPATFANALTTPDAEHLCIAMLAMEGTASDIASANWDGLIEKAMKELCSSETLTVCVKGQDMRGPVASTMLYKYHGCAVLARDDEPNYRPRLVARQSQISGWATKAENLAIVNRLTDIASTKRTLMIGLSAQDANIQALFAKAQGNMEWPWPSTDLAYVFSEDALGIDQKGLLQNVYPAAFSAATRGAIYSEARIQAFAKPLLVALVLHVLSTKIAALAEKSPGVLDAAGRQEIHDGILEVRNAVSEFAEGHGHEQFVRELVAQSERTLTLFREGCTPPLGSLEYQPVSCMTVAATLADVGVASSGIREMGVGIGLLGIGLNKNHWTLKPADRTSLTSGALRVATSTGEVSLFFAANANVALRLLNNGNIDDDENTVVIHSLEIVPSLTRSPRSSHGRTGKSSLREVSISNLMSSANDATTLLERFREDTAL